MASPAAFSSVYIASMYVRRSASTCVAFVCVKEISPKLDQGIPEYNLGSLLMRVRGVLARGVLARGVSARYNVFSTECVLYRMCSLQNVFSRSSQRVL